MSEGGQSTHVVPVLEKLGRFDILSELKRGRVDCYVARKAGSRDLLMLKTLSPTHALDPLASAQFLEEARVGSILRHPAIVRTDEVCVERGVFCFTSELVVGFELEEVVAELTRRAERIPLDIAARILVSLLDALEYAHTCREAGGRPSNIVHGSISPSCVRLGLRGEVKLGEFSAIRPARVDPLHPPEEVAHLFYVPPDQLELDVARASSDVYAVAALFYEMTTGQELVSRRLSFARRIEQIRTRVPLPHLRRVAPDLPEGLAAVIDRALAPDEGDRFESVTALRAAVESSYEKPLAPPAALASFLEKHMAERVEALTRDLATWMAVAKGRDEDEMPPQTSIDGVGGQTSIVPRRAKLIPVTPSNSAAVLDMPGEAAPLGKTSIRWLRRQATRRPSILGVLLLTILLLQILIIVKLTHGPVSGLESPSPRPNVTVMGTRDSIPVSISASSDDESALARASVREGGKATVSSLRPRVATSERELASSGLVRVAPGEESPDAAVRRRQREGVLAALRASAKPDPTRYLALIKSIERALVGVPEPRRGRIKSDLVAAERTYDLDLVSRALDQLDRSAN